MEFNQTKSYSRDEIYNMCMNNQSDPDSICIYRKYLSKNSSRPISSSQHYFILRTPDGILLKKDRDFKPKDVAKIYKIPMDTTTHYRGHILIASKRHPSEVREIMIKKKYRRMINEAIDYVIHSYPKSCEIIGTYEEEFPENKLFVYLKGEVKNVNKDN